MVRNGVLYRQTPFDDVCVINNDGSMQTFTADEFDIEDITQNGAWQVWSFGPMLLRDGVAMDEFNSSVNPTNPRTAIGYVEPGHYMFVVVDGRQDGYSEGMTLQELSSLMESLGCVEAYNLDGGQTTSMVFNGEEINSPYEGGRDLSDIVYIGE